MKQLSPAPDWMLETPKPQIEVRTLSGVQMAGYYGRIRLTDVEYFIDNRRTERQVTGMRRRINGTPANGQLVDALIDDPDLDIERLARNIIENGLRVPIILSAGRKLLDGNRRYLAHRWIMKNGTPQQKDEFEKLDAWVLSYEYSDERDEIRVIAEYNFLDDFKERWTDYVKARFLWEEQFQRGRTSKELVELYGGPGFSSGKIAELIGTYEVILEYGNFLGDEDKAQEAGADHFVWFQQLFRSYRQWMREDEEFQRAVFTNIRNEKIDKTDELKNLTELRKYRDAWALFKQGDVEDAHYLRQGYKRQEKQRLEPDKLIGQVNAALKRLLDEGMVEKIADESLAEFHDLSIRLPGQVEDPNVRVAYLVSQLQALTSLELRELTDDNLSALETEIKSVARQVRSTRG